MAASPLVNVRRALRSARRTRCAAWSKAAASAMALAALARFSGLVSALGLGAKLAWLDPPPMPVPSIASVGSRALVGAVTVGLDPNVSRVP